MASIAWQKMHSRQEIFAKLKHNEKEIRESGNHSNIFIDKTMTKYNIDFMGLSYEEQKEKFNARIKQLDETTNKNKRKDRVEAIQLEVPAPSGLTPEEEQKFFRGVFNTFSHIFGEKNVIAAYVDMDEKHLYLDPKSKDFVMSRDHLHFTFIPEKDGQLNARGIETRKRMKTLNQSLEDSCFKTFGVHYMTGEEPRKQSVEELKRASMAAYNEQIAFIEKNVEIAQKELEMSYNTALEEDRENFKKMTGMTYETACRVIELNNEIGGDKISEILKMIELEDKNERLSAQLEKVKKKDPALYKEITAEKLPEKSVDFENLR